MFYKIRLADQQLFSGLKIELFYKGTNKDFNFTLILLLVKELEQCSLTKRERKILKKLPAARPNASAAVSALLLVFL